MLRNILAVSLLLVACGSSQQNVRPTADSSGAPPPLDQTAIDVAMERVRPLARACVQPGRNQQTWSVKLTIRGDGHPADVSVENPQDGPEIAVCLEGAVSSAVFPRFTGPPMTIVYPYYVQ